MVIDVLAQTSLGNLNHIKELERRLEKLEKENGRLEAHIKWFVMRRSGTDELRKMEAAMTRLEAANGM
jgi:hypothetical protein